MVSVLSIYAKRKITMKKVFQEKEIIKRNRYENENTHAAL